MRLYDSQWQYEPDQRKQMAMRYRIAQRALAAFRKNSKPKCNCQNCECKKDDGDGRS